MLCCKLNLPEPFSWRIKGIGKGTGLVAGLQKIMQLPQCSDDTAEITVMPRSFYNRLSDGERSGFEVFYSRHAVRLLNNKKSDKWLLVFPENILENRSIRIILMWLILRPFHLRCLSNGGLPVHASSAELNGKSIIIAAAGDTGKTTTIRRLPPPWRELGDDASLLLPNGNDFYLYPFPTWSEFIYGATPSASWTVTHGVKLAGIYFLKQAYDDKTFALPSASAMIALQQSVMEAVGELKDDISYTLNLKIFETISRIVKAVPAFTLHATLSGEIWKNIEETMKNEE